MPAKALRSAALRWREQAIAYNDNLVYDHMQHMDDGNLDYGSRLYWRSKRSARDAVQNAAEVLAEVFIGFDPITVRKGRRTVTLKLARTLNISARPLLMFKNVSSTKETPFIHGEALDDGGVVELEVPGIGPISLVLPTSGSSGDIDIDGEVSVLVGAETTVYDSDDNDDEDAGSAMSQFLPGTIP